MMKLHSIIRDNYDGASEDTMWKSVKLISHYLHDHRDQDPEGYDHLMKTVYGMMKGEHYDETFGRDRIDKMYYLDGRGSKHIAPYWTDEEMHNVYETVKHTLPNGLSEWDFYVVLNMVMSDNANLLRSWFPGITEADLTNKVVEMAVTWINDPDSEHKCTKVWHYFE